VSARAALVRVHVLAINCPWCDEGLGTLERDGGVLIGTEISERGITRGEVFVCEACDEDYRIPASAWRQLGLA